VRKIYRDKSLKIEHIVTILYVYRVIKTHMEFPDEVLGIIRAYAKPMGRRDWKTCKQHESNVILWHNQYTLNHSWTVYSETRNMAYEIASWTLHGRRRALQHLIQWLPAPVQPDGDWYENRIRTYDWQADELATQG
jgi:hypothetical protein